MIACVVMPKDAIVWEYRIMTHAIIVDFVSMKMAEDAREKASVK